MSRITLKTYKATFAGGVIKTVQGRYAAHAWAWAQHCHPDLVIKQLDLVETTESEQEP